MRTAILVPIPGRPGYVVHHFSRDPKSAWNWLTSADRRIETAYLVPEALLPNVGLIAPDHPTIRDCTSHHRRMLHPAVRAWLDDAEATRDSAMTAFRLSDADRHLLAQIGDGNMSDGLRVLLAKARNANTAPPSLSDLV